MRVSYRPAALPGQPALAGASDETLVGARFILARVVALAVSVLTLVLFVGSVSTVFAQLRTVCTAAECGDNRQLTMDQFHVLEESGLSLTFYAAYHTTFILLVAMVWFVLAAMIAWRAPTQRVALVLPPVFVLVGAGLVGIMDQLATFGYHWGLVGKLWGNLGFAAFFILLYLIPDGRFVPGWTRWLTIGTIGHTLVSVFFPGSPVSLYAWGLGWLHFMLLVVTSIFAQVYRYLRVSGKLQRQQTKWVVFGVAAALGTSLMLATLADFFSLEQPNLLGLTVQAAINYMPMLLIPLSIATAVSRYRLWDIDPIINRTLVYGALTACVVAVYVLVVGSFGRLFQAGGNLAISLLATGVAAVLFQPLRAWLQRGVNRLMYGERDEPYAVLSRLGQRLEASLAPDTVLPTIVQTVREALKLPYAAIAIKHDDAFAVAAVSGEAVSEPERLPLVYQGEVVGQLLLSPRAAGESFSPADRRLLDDLARQAGVAVHAVRLTTDLQRSRERLVTTREEERRRLRRDLHDGLGPQLAALNLQAGTLRSLIPRDPVAALERVEELRTDLRAAIADIRRLVYGLRPPALDEVGLVAALRRRAAQLSEPTGGTGERDANRAAAQGVQVVVEAPEELPLLPAAVEVAVYRIVEEALTNVVRHARAWNCRVHLTVADDLQVEVVDDGVGLPREHHAGVGLVAMRERAEELGGTCKVESASGSGTRVLVRLSLNMVSEHNTVSKPRKE